MEDNTQQTPGQAPMSKESQPAQPTAGSTAPSMPTATPEPAAPASMPPQPQPQVPLSPEVKPKKGAGAVLWIGVGFLVIALIGAGAYVLGTRSGLIGGTAVTPTPLVTPTPTPTPTLTTYTEKNGRYSFEYPSEATVQEQEDGSVTVILWGPTQKENTEFYDGLSLSFKTGALAGKTIMALSQEKQAEFKDLSETSTPSAVTVASVSGYAFHVTGLGEADHYYLPLDTKNYLEMVDSTKDPSQQGYVKMAQDILASLVLNPQATPSATPTGTPSATVTP